MSSTKNLLVELRVEELPPKALKALSLAFADGLAHGLREQGLLTGHSAVTPYATPRRLAVHISAVHAFAADAQRSHKLMPVSVGLDASGQATPALLKKLGALGADASVVPKLRRQLDGKSEALFLDATVKGATLHDGLQTALDAALAKLPIPKLMQYQLADGWTSVQFVRPAHGLVALHGAEVVPITALGLAAGRDTEGHRFEAPLSPVRLSDADHYARQLDEQGAVIASFDARHGEISRQLHAAAAKESLSPIEDAALLDEVTALVERPNVVLCEFERQFLDVPQECLILTMKANQKYFPLLDAQGRLTNKFLVVSNIRAADMSRVIGGNERVVRPRLADAKFFFDQDRKRTLESRIAGLDKVVYHHQLGSLGERVRRVAAIARELGRHIGSAGGAGGEALAQQAERAARLAKADLLTDMVGEFPELQGIMGGYYARHDGLSDEVAFAIEDHYRPRFAGDVLPRTTTGIVVALADKLETLVGMFEIGELPSGDRDPFALRRHALGVLRMCMERNLPFELGALIEMATQAWDRAQAQTENEEWLEQARKGVVVTRPSLALFQASISAKRLQRHRQILDFMFDRLSVLLRDQSFSASEVSAVLSVSGLVLAGVSKRLAAVRTFCALPESNSLAAANKRVGNILKKTADAAVPADVDPARLVEPAERALHQALLDIAPRSQAAFDAGEYTTSLQLLAALRTPVDAFFDSVMVNADDPRLRANRLSLLERLRTAMNRVADLSKLAA
jgi:glycyl-tRNA synthetase beta chain